MHEGATSFSATCLLESGVRPRFEKFPLNQQTPNPRNGKAQAQRCIEAHSKTRGNSRKEWFRFSGSKGRAPAGLRPGFFTASKENPPEAGWP